MSLKAGRVGVNPADVDPISGRISPEATDSYTKAQADDKFLSKSDASSTYETKSAAADLQPKTLAVPIELLSGSKFTVESALQGLASTKANTDILPSTTDLNDITDPGFYFANDVSTNAPSTIQTTFYLLIVGRFDNNSVRQMIVTKNMIYTRSKGGSPSTWSNWFYYTGTEIV